MEVQALCKKNGRLGPSRSQTLHLSGVVWAAHFQRGPSSVIQQGEEGEQDPNWVWSCKEKQPHCHLVSATQPTTSPCSSARRYLRSSYSSLETTTKNTAIKFMITIIGGGKQLCVLPPENFLSRPPHSFCLPANNSFPESLGAKGLRNQQALSHNSQHFAPLPPPSVSSTPTPSLQEFKPVVECLSLNSGRVEKWKVQMSQLYSNTPV